MKKLLLVASSLIAVFSVTLVPIKAEAGLLDSFKGSACEAVSPTNDPNCTKGDGAINTLLETILNILSLIVGVIAVIILIISGIKFITSQGDPQAISSARNTIIYAVIGLVVVAVAQFIVRFVLSRVASA